MKKTPKIYNKLNYEDHDMTSINSILLRPNLQIDFQEKFWYQIFFNYYSNLFYEIDIFDERKRW